jgi:hypothetical protein
MIRRAHRNTLTMPVDELARIERKVRLAACRAERLVAVFARFEPASPLRSRYRIASPSPAERRSARCQSLLP